MYVAAWYCFSASTGRGELVSCIFNLHSASNKDGLHEEVYSRNLGRICNLA